MKSFARFKVESTAYASHSINGDANIEAHFVSEDYLHCRVSKRDCKYSIDSQRRTSCFRARARRHFRLLRDFLSEKAERLCQMLRRKSTSAVCFRVHLGFSFISPSNEAKSILHSCGMTMMLVNRPSVWISGFRFQNQAVQDYDVSNTAFSFLGIPWLLINCL
jgi:hypothetical protein